MTALDLSLLHAQTRCRPAARRFWLIFFLAGLSALVFNLVMPQGIGFLPPGIKDPLWREVGLAEARAMWDQGALFVDARDPGPYKLARVKGAVSIYPQQLEMLARLLHKKLAAAPALVVYGKTRSRYMAATVAQYLIKKGMKKVVVMERNFDQWLLAGYPVIQRRVRVKP